jgi:hypothetical protein
MTHKLLNDGFDHVGEAQTLVWLTVPNVLAQNSNNFSVGVGEEVVASFEEYELQLLV